MPSTAQEVYNEIIQSLSTTEQFRLATLIMNKLVQQNLPIIDQKDDWTEQDQADVVNFSLQNGRYSFPSEVVQAALKLLEKQETLFSQPPVIPKEKSSLNYDFSDLMGRLTWRGDAVVMQRNLRDEW